MHVDFPDIQALINKGLARIGSSQISSGFDKLLIEKFPWKEISNTQLDWDKIEKAISIDLSISSTQDIANFIEKTTVNRYDQLCIVYSAVEPCLFVSKDTFIKQIDLLTRSAITCYLIGVVNVQEKKISETDFLEFHLDDSIRLSGMAHR